MSAASFLGITGAIALIGFDGFYMSVGNLLGFLFLLYLIAEPMRNLGKYTLADMITSRFKSNQVRGTAAASTLVISLFYMIAQLVGGGGLISLMLGIDYWLAVVIVGVLMTIYVIFAMTATSLQYVISRDDRNELGTDYQSYPFTGRFICFNIFSLC